MNKMQHISIAFIDVNSVKFAFSAGLNNIYLFCEDTSVNGNVLTNHIYIRLEKTHEVTRCKQTLYVHEDPFTLRTHTHTHKNTHTHTHTHTKTRTHTHNIFLSTHLVMLMNAEFI